MLSIDVERAIEQLTIDEKVKLLAGKDSWSTFAVEHLGIPSITTSDGPHGVRGTHFFNGPAGMLLPSATAMGATFDVDLMHKAGQLLAAEAKERECSIILGPTVCIQRSPLLGRAFEAFAEDPCLSGNLAAAYINGVQENGVACSIKHYAAHDQSQMSVEDDVRASERTLREVHLLPFQIAVRDANPWSFMMAYNMINGIHASEDPWLMKKVLREDWGWDGLVMSDWFGTYSTSESVNAGMDLEMPGPTRWRGDLLLWAVLSGKVKKSTIDERVRNLLNLVNKVQPWREVSGQKSGDTQEKRDLSRRVAGESIVLLKNDQSMLPLDRTSKKTYGLIGSAVHSPAISGGGSADLPPYYISTPYDAFVETVGAENVQSAVGCQAFQFTPQLTANVHVPNSDQPGFLVEWFKEDPLQHPVTERVASVTTKQAQMYFADSLPTGVPPLYWLKAITKYTAPKTCTVQLGLCILGKGRLYVDGQEKIDLYTSQPPKTMQTPMFNQASMEVTAEIEVEQGKEYEIMVWLESKPATAGVGALPMGGLRIGCCEKMDPANALREAVELAKNVNVPVVIAGLNSDFESEAMDRESLALPPGVDELIESVLKANPNTIVFTQSGSPIALPWVDRASTLIHAWFGGQETGHAIADVLFGRVNPCGRLSMTFPKRLEDTPTFLTFGKADRQIYYGEGVFVGYRYYEKLRNAPMFHFGQGLSYTSFEYSNLAVPKTIKITKNETFEVTVEVANTGKRAGHEIVQLYVADQHSSVLRPVKELKGFRKIWLEAGESKRTSFTLDKYAVSFWDGIEHSWLAESGKFDVIIAKSADPKDEMLRKTFELERNLTWTGV